MLTALLLSCYGYLINTISVLIKPQRRQRALACISHGTLVLNAAYSHLGQKQLAVHVPAESRLLLPRKKKKPLVSLRKKFLPLEPENQP